MKTETLDVVSELRAIAQLCDEVVRRVDLVLHVEAQREIEKVQTSNEKQEIPGPA